MDKININTILGMDLFKDKLRKSLIFHIPHSKTEIPNEFKSDFVDEDLTNREIDLLTDFATDEIFSIKDTSKIVFPYSRVFCDVERLSDDQEVMFKVGRGFYYTQADCGKELRILNEFNKQKVYDNYYLKHHNELTNLVDKKLEENSFAVIIDCHSYSDKPFQTDLVCDNNRPDFCLGTDSFHTPKWLVDMIYIQLINLGYSVEINSPYEGTIIPLKHYKKDENVYSVMIEINRKLHMDNDYKVNNDMVKKLNNIINSLF
jgi:N-formylglutamate amidohydrolase